MHAPRALGGSCKEFLPHSATFMCNSMYLKSDLKKLRDNTNS